MSEKAKVAQRAKDEAKGYSKFDQLDGSHPWAKVVPEAAVLYRVRELQKGEVVYFNFGLAKEMGLIPGQHPDRMNQTLHQKLIDTFSIQIINEYDEIKKTPFEESTIKPGRYMATRYLQLQHPSRTGKTSGDGRGIWNGVIQNRGTTWDVSSRGTGVTCLAPGAVLAQKPLRTGNPQFGYGCGQAEIDELIAAIIQSEIFHIQGISTERVLCVIDLGGGVGIGVRAAPNLLRPAHLFPALKQGNRDLLTRATNYLIQRQVTNQRWKISSKRPYQSMLRIMTESLAEFTSRLELEYIFAWLDWDGDNLLADAGIIDYGSVRQFGARHDQYRYDDVDRFSTTLLEQKKKARQLIQVLSQMVDFLETGRRKPLSTFDRAPAVKAFAGLFHKHYQRQWLLKAGLSEKDLAAAARRPKELSNLINAYRKLESFKVRGGIRPVPDGINHPALFDLRPALSELPKMIQKFGFERGLPNPASFLESMLTDEATARDRKFSADHLRSAQNFLLSYVKFFRRLQGNQHPHKFWAALSERSGLANRRDRMTGNALIQVTNLLLEERKKGLTTAESQSLLTLLIQKFGANPKSTYPPMLVKRPDILDQMLQLIEECRHDI